MVYKVRSLIIAEHSFLTGALLADIYGLKGQAASGKGSAYMAMVPEEGSWTTMTSVHPERIRHKRKLVSNMVSNDAIRAFGPRESLYLDTFCNIIGEKTGANGWSSPRNMTADCQKSVALSKWPLTNYFQAEPLW